MAIGQSFQPGAENGQQQQNGSRRPPVQEAIRLLSLRLPTVVGARGIAPQQLLQGQGSAGLGGGPMSLGAALEWLRKLMSGQGEMGTPPELGSVFGGGNGGINPGPLPTGSGGNIPSPFITPGQQSPERASQIPNIPPASEFDYNNFDQAGYQQYQQNNPSNPKSPYEYWSGWPGDGGAGIASGEPTQTGGTFQTLPGGTSEPPSGFNTGTTDRFRELPPILPNY